MPVGSDSHPSNRQASRLSSLLGAVRLVHVFPSVTVIVGSVLLMFVAHHGIPPLGLALRGVAVVAASQVAVGALNDFIDRYDDARTQPNKPLPSKQVGPSVAVAMVGVGVALCCSFALTFGLTSLGIVALGLSSGLAYDLWLKRTPYSPGSYMISFLSLLTWIWLIAGTLTWAIVIMYPLGACLLLAAHLANALPDAQTDAALGQRGLVVVLGPRRALNIVLSVGAGATAWALVFCAVERSFLGLVFSLASSILVASAAWLARQSGLDRHSLQLIFRCIAPAIALIAASSLLAFESAT
jgi:4-hydroxybenzoate polyprenyltransferase